MLNYTNIEREALVMLLTNEITRQKCGGQFHDWLAIERVRNDILAEKAQDPVYGPNCEVHIGDVTKPEPTNDGVWVIAGAFANKIKLLLEGDGQIRTVTCTPAEAKEALKHIGEPWPLIEKPVEVGDYVKKVTGDYQIYGTVVSVFSMTNGAIRVVVEHRAEGGGSFCHIYNPNQLVKVAQTRQKLEDYIEE